MANNLGVSPSVLQETVNTLREQKAIMTTKLDNVHNAVDELNSSWQSDAANSLKSIASTMSEKFAGLEREVENFSVFLEGVIANYEIAEQQAMNVTDGIKNAFQ